MSTLGGSEWAEIVAALLAAGLIVWTHRTWSELIRAAFRAAPVWTVTLPLAIIGLSIFLYWHWFGWHLPWRAQ